MENQKKKRKRIRRDYTFYMDILSSSEVLTASEIASLLGVSVKTAEGWLRKARLLAANTQQYDKNDDVKVGQVIQLEEYRKRKGERNARK